MLPGFKQLRNRELSYPPEIIELPAGIPRKIELQYIAIDFREIFDVLEAGALIELIGALADQAELRHRAIGLDETRIRGSAPGAEAGRQAGDALHRLGQHIAHFAPRHD